jgi:hypothetical protein
MNDSLPVHRALKGLIFAGVARSLGGFVTETAPHHLLVIGVEEGGSHLQTTKMNGIGSTFVKNFFP